MRTDLLFIVLLAVCYSIINQNITKIVNSNYVYDKKNGIAFG